MHQIKTKARPVAQTFSAKSVITVNFEFNSENDGRWHVFLDPVNLDVVRCGVVFVIMFAIPTPIDAVREPTLSDADSESTSVLYFRRWPPQ